MRRSFAVSTLFVCALGALFLAPTTAHAAQISLLYRLSMAEDSTVAGSPDNTNAQLLAANKSSLELEIARDCPYFQLDNFSPTASLSKLTISLGQLPYNFDILKMIVLPAGITYITNIDAVENGLRSDNLVINFNGFAPGKSIRFQTNIDRDSGNTNMLVDYRDILFNTLNSPSSNGTNIKVDFTNPGYVGSLSDSQFLPEYPDYPALATSSIAFKSSTSSQVVFAPGFNCNIPVFLTGDPSERVTPFVLDGQKIVTLSVPEPNFTIFYMLILGLVGIRLTLRQRQRNSLKLVRVQRR